jgi:hypothetical protein
MSYPTSACVWITYPLLPTKFLLLSRGEHVDPTFVRILTSQLLKVEMLQENRLITHEKPINKKITSKTKEI